MAQTTIFAPLQEAQLDDPRERILLPPTNPNAEVRPIRNSQLRYSSSQLKEVQNQGFTNQIILLPPASKPVTLYLMQKKTALIANCELRIVLELAPETIECTRLIQ
jgi:hypothetical protein